MIGKHLKVFTETSHWSCGDGCCDNYNYETVITDSGKEYYYNKDSNEAVEIHLRDVHGITFEYNFLYHDYDYPEDSDDQET